MTESVDLTTLSYRPDGSDHHPNRALDEPPGVGASSTLPVPGLRFGIDTVIWALIALCVAIVVVAVGLTWYARAVKWGAGLPARIIPGGS